MYGKSPTCTCRRCRQRPELPKVSMPTMGELTSFGCHAALAERLSAPRQQPAAYPSQNPSQQIPSAASLSLRGALASGYFRRACKCHGAEKRAWRPYSTAPEPEAAVVPATHVRHRLPQGRSGSGQSYGALPTPGAHQGPGQRDLFLLGRSRGRSGNGWIGDWRPSRPGGAVEGPPPRPGGHRGGG